MRNLFMTMSSLLTVSFAAGEPSACEADDAACALVFDPTTGTSDELAAFCSVSSVRNRCPSTCCSEPVYRRRPRPGVGRFPAKEAFAEITSDPKLGVSGRLTFKQDNANSPVVITGSLIGLPPGEHGFHVHEHGDTTNKCNAAGAHYNPFNATHGSPNVSNRHVGDLGNIITDKQSKTTVHIVDTKISLYPTSYEPYTQGIYPAKSRSTRLILNRTIVIHADKDDLGDGGNEESLKTGNSGARLACGVIQITPQITPQSASGVVALNLFLAFMCLFLATFSLNILE